MKKEETEKAFVIDKNNPVQKLLRDMRVMHNEKLELDKQKLELDNRLFEIFMHQVEQLDRTSSGSPSFFRGPSDDGSGKWEDIKKRWEPSK